MTVSGIWWKRLDATLRSIALAPLLLMLGGCGVADLLLGRPPAQDQQEPPSPLRPSAEQTDVSAGLSRLPTPQQVLTTVPFGRQDPFAPLPASQAAAPPAGGAVAGSQPAGTPAGAAAAAATAAAGQPVGSPARLMAPEGFRLTGVIRSSGRAEALVTFGPLSGSLKPGDLGGRSTALLPAGWTLASIQFGGRTPQDPPSVLLQKGNQKVKVSL